MGQKEGLLVSIKMFEEEFKFKRRANTSLSPIPINLPLHNISQLNSTQFEEIIQTLLRANFHNTDIAPKFNCNKKRRGRSSLS